MKSTCLLLRYVRLLKAVNGGNIGTKSTNYDVMRNSSSFFIDLSTKIWKIMMIYCFQMLTMQTNCDSVVYKCGQMLIRIDG